MGIPDVEAPYVRDLTFRRHESNRVTECIPPCTPTGTRKQKGSRGTRLSTPLRRHVTVCGPKSQERGEPPGHSKPNHRPYHPWGAEGRRRSLREAKSNGVGRGGKGRLGPTLDQKRFRPRRWPLSKVSKAVSELTMPCHCLPLPLPRQRIRLPFGIFF